jgi:uncharacterized protein YfaP (DUF2135 family)
MTRFTPYFGMDYSKFIKECSVHIVFAQHINKRGSGMKNFLKSMLTIVATSLIVACGGGGGGGTTPPNANTGTITGKAIDASSGTGIANTKVSVGTLTTTTDAQGRFTLTQVASANRVALQFDAPNYAEGLGVVGLPAGGSVSLTTKLLPVGASAIIDNAAGGTINVPNSTAQVVLPANAFNGTGTFTVAVTPINPAIDSAVMPGDFTTAGGTQSIESFGALAVMPRNAAGQPVDLAVGRTATIRIPAVSKGGALAATIPLFYVDKNTGSWVREGTATLAGTAPNQYYEGTVAHFSVWNADQVINTVQFSGCVVDSAGARVSGARVFSDGIDYSGTASGVTDASGTFSVAMKSSATAVFTGSKGDAFTNSVSKTSSNANFSDTTCLVLNRAVNSIKIQLTWGENPADADSHLIAPSGEQVYWENLGSLGVAPFANLDVDDQTSFGPEIITINRLMVGTYTYGVNLFEGTGSLSNSPIRVELNIGGNLRIFNPPAGETASTPFLRLFTLTVDSTCNVTVQAVNAWEAGPPPQVAPTSTPVYCTAP